MFNVQIYVKMLVIDKTGISLTSVCPEDIFYSSVTSITLKLKYMTIVIKRHEDDATSVTLLVSELREELFDPVLIFKPQGSRSAEYPTIPEESLSLHSKPSFSCSCTNYMHQPFSALIQLMVLTSTDLN